jgi:hypothetical protein
MQGDDMKKTILILSVCIALCLMFSAVRVFAEYEDLRTIKGKIESILLGGGPLSGNKSEIVVIDEKGQQVRFTVRTGIGVTVSGKDKLTSLKNLVSGDTVSMEYIKNRDGTNKVMSIELFSYQKR